MINLLNQVQAARLLGVHPITMGVWRKRGFGPPWIKMGPKVRYTETALEEWLASIERRPEDVKAEFERERQRSKKSKNQSRNRGRSGEVRPDP